MLGGSITIPTKTAAAVQTVAPRLGTLGAEVAGPAFLFLAAVALIGIPALVRPMASFDEGFYASSARQMLRSGDFGTPYFNGHTFWDKSPLGIWLIAGSMTLFGCNEWGARFPSVVSAIACLALVHAQVKRNQGHLAALLAGWTLLSAQDFLRFAAKGQLDLLLTLWITAQLVCFHRGLTQPRWHLLAGAFLGLAIATKNQAGLLGSLIQIVYIAASRDVRPLRRWEWFGGTLIGMLLPIPWFAQQYMQHGATFLQEFVETNTVGRLPGGGSSGGAVDPLFLVRYLLERHAVLLVFAAVGLVWVACQPGGRNDQLPILLAVWLVVVPAFYACFGATHYWYLIPMYPAAAWLFAFAVYGMLCSHEPSATDRVLSMVGKSTFAMRTVVAAVAVWAIAFQVSYYLPPPREPDLWAAKRLGPAVQANSATDEEVLLLSRRDDPRAIHAPAAHFYFDRVCRYVESADELSEILARRPQVVIVTRSDSFDAVCSRCVESSVSEASRDGEYGCLVVKAQPIPQSDEVRRAAD